MIRVDNKLFVVLKEIGLKKEHLTVFFEISFFIECCCDVIEDTTNLIRKNQSLPFFYSLIKIKIL